MKRIFTRACKSFAKYFIFSAFLVMALFARGEEASAANPSHAYAPNKSGVGASESITPIEGSLSTTCVAPAMGNYLPYEIVGSSHSGNVEYSGCVSYTGKEVYGANTGEKQYFYIQAKAAPTANEAVFTQITFKVFNVPTLHHYVTVFEDNFTLSDTSRYDYDQFTLSTGTTYNYVRKVGTGKTADENGSLTVSGSAGNYTYQFTYTLRDAPDQHDYDGDSTDGDEYGAHNLYVYFYEATPNANNGTKGTEVSYTLVRPISEYAEKIDVKYDSTITSSNIDTDAICNVSTDTTNQTNNIANDKICILYAPAPNTGATVNATKTNKFLIKASNNIALYFSTANTHKVGGQVGVNGTVTTEHIKTYNTIYGTNEFENLDGSDVRYHYYNGVDKSSYNYAITSQATNFYKFEFTIDASGNYKFTFTDIFGNTVTSSNAAVVNDISNRSLSTYYIKYSDLTKAEEDADSKNAAAYGLSIDSFELKDDLSVITNQNVVIGLEFYFKIDIQPSFGIYDSTSEAEIKTNPLDADEIRFAEDTSPRTFYCRMVAYNSSYDEEGDGNDVTMCATGGTTGSQFILNRLDSPQNFGANLQTGLKAIKNPLNYFKSILDTKIANAVVLGASDKKQNRVSFEINENGRYFVRLQDKHGNSMVSTIDVSIIDQLNPLIHFNGSNTTLNNVICSSMYVVGGGGNIHQYPTKALETSDCVANSITYDKFEAVDVDDGTEKTDTIRVQITRDYEEESVTGGKIIGKTNGFYKSDSSSVAFNYADAIRMALLTSTDYIKTYGVSTNFAKSVYRNNNNTYTSYGIYTYAVKSGVAAGFTEINEGTQLEEKIYDFGADPHVTGTGHKRYNMKNDYIIANNYLQYSSELYSYFSDSEYVWFNVYNAEANGTRSDLVCSSQGTDNGSRTRPADCYNIVNAYIDKSISFHMEFFIRDYAGNVSTTSNDGSLGNFVYIEVVDDTTPGILNINSSTHAIVGDPIIAGNNIDTVCRLEIGSVIQNKNQLLACYGFIAVDNSGNPTQYYFVDNATSYVKMTSATYSGMQYYQNILYEQLYKSSGDYAYDVNIKVYVCKERGDGACSVTSPGKWQLITDSISPTDTDYQFVNAGDYEIKFVITDTGKEYTTDGGQSHEKNEITIIANYYVNPRILLVRPLEESKEYGANTQSMDYCIYATTDTNAFFYNVFNLPSTYHTDTYGFIREEYESSQYGIVYCSNDKNPAANSKLDDATKVDQKRILGRLDNGTLESGARLTGGLARTYATGVNKYNMEMGTSTFDIYNGKGYTTVYNAYEDVGYYYMTLGNLTVVDPNYDANAGYQENFILRLHPYYLLDGMTPNTSLKSYNHSTIVGNVSGDDTYKDYGFGDCKNEKSHGETISNVLFTIYQKQLVVTANGGRKMYGNTDTNYMQAFNKNATNNISSLTTVHQHPTDFDTFVNDAAIARSVSGYLNGFTVSGLIATVTETNPEKLNDYNNMVKNDYFNDIIQGFLRRDGGENVGKYYICNNSTAVINTLDHSSSGCDLYTDESGEINRNSLDGHVVNLTISNVYKLTSSGYEQVTSEDDIVYGRYVKIDSTYYKLTRNNTDLANKKFNDNFSAQLWRFDYDDSAYSLKILNNANNANQNYYISYYDNMYTINPGEVVVQPGMNQGKEYSNPEHNNPIFEIVVYGEKTSISASETTGSSFNGYTQSIEKIPYPHEETNGADDYKKKINVNTYSNTSGNKAADTSVYFTDRRTNAHEVAATYVYQYKDEKSDANNKFKIEDNKFKLDGVEYCVNGTKIWECTDKNNATHLLESGGKIGAKTVTIVNGEKVVVTIEGYLTYQDYKLFTSSSTGANPGTGYINREKLDEYDVNWYKYTYSSDNLHVVSNANLISQTKTNYCTHSSYTFSIGGDGYCVNYNVTYTDKPANVVDSVYTSYEDSNVETHYRHNGVNLCTDDNGKLMYTVKCTSDTSIQFLIFKRDIILSFNAQSYVYGQVYSYYANASKTGKFDIAKEGASALPYVIESYDAFATPAYSYTGSLLFTCYRKAADNEAGYVAANNRRYIALDEAGCNSVDYGISTSDVWGEGGGGVKGVKLQFFLHNAVGDLFTESYYAIPAGLYEVYAAIGDATDNTKHGTAATYEHPDYNLVYLDYDIIVAGQKTSEGELSPEQNTKKGTLEITSRAVKLQGTYYQKEFGQALYSMYDEHGSALQFSNNAETGVYQYYLSHGKQINIFDNHYYYCADTVTEAYNGTTVTYGCSYMVHADDQSGLYSYHDISNVYLYTVIDDGNNTNDFQFTGVGAMNTAGAKVDEIIANFAGSPIRLGTGATSGTYAPTYNADDVYGLLDDVGYYNIYLGNIVPVVARYKNGNADVVFSKDTGTIKRDENYSLPTYDDSYSGVLYITPAKIEISVTSSQKKMYGCAYNTMDSDLSDISYSYAEGYANCVEGVEQYYDLGYEYTVKGDKAKYLKDNFNAKVKTFAACDTLSDREAATAESCKDISYTTEQLTYTVTPDYNDSTKKANKPANHSLNSGTLYRINADLVAHQVANDATKVTFNYKTYFEYATNAQLDPSSSNIKFQEQKVGTYAITLGNLDAEFNTNKHCNSTSSPVFGGGTSLCKNFIVMYGPNNTTKHTNTGDAVAAAGNEDETFDDGLMFTLSINAFKFEIATRNVVMTTEYNYKVYGDTDPYEGYECSDLKAMFTYPDTWYGKEFKYDDRSYCSNDDTFIHTGVARYYAIDNSLAKAPWTAWVDNGNEAGTYYKYNDALFDVILSTSTMTRKGENTSDPAKNDAVGKYALKYNLTLNGGTNGNGSNNYAIRYINYTTADGEDEAINTTTDSAKVDGNGFTVGFAAAITGNTTAASLVTYDRWYRDENHKCIISTSGNVACNAYTGTQIYKFQINGIEHDQEDYVGNKYYTYVGTGADKQEQSTNLYEAIYFEIVRREIFVETLPVTKDFGIEEEYTDFTVRLCSAYDPDTKVCSPVKLANVWGIRNSLSLEDFEAFYTSDGNGSYVKESNDENAHFVIDQTKFKGSDTKSDYRGGTDNKAFGIYMYRTYGEDHGTYAIVACPTQFADDLACRTYYHNKATATQTRKADDSLINTEIGIFWHEPTSNSYNASNYIVKTIPSTLTINRRDIYITPHSNQGFMYGNYEAGDMIAPITYYEEYVIDGTTQAGFSGLVNGSLKSKYTTFTNEFTDDDHINHQIALCIYDISSRMTCINDRQNDNSSIVTSDFITTGLHNGGTSISVKDTKGSAGITNALDQSGHYGLIQNNVYSDQYGEDNDTERHALNRKEKESGATNQRYNRNVGTYVITQGDIGNNYCASGSSTNCLNDNYNIVGFKEGVEYVITPATIVVTPRSNQTKIYGEEDVHLTFDVATYFTYHNAPNGEKYDRYYCSYSAICQDKVFGPDDGSLQISFNETTFQVVLNGFAYSENALDADNNISGNNYGVSRVSNKTNTAKDIDSGYGAADSYYYDKYCLNRTSFTEIDTCSEYTNADKLAKITFGSTSRILLGYFYVHSYHQQVGTHAIKSAITVALNEYGNVNYLYKAQVSDATIVPVGTQADTGVTFAITKRDISVTIKDIQKVYGQATDSFKCDANAVAKHYSCKKDNALNDTYGETNNAAHNNDGRLEYNFDAFDKDDVDLYDSSAGKTILIKAISGKYYTETGNAEYKNIHLGLTVVRAINDDDGTKVCGLNNDKYGCEDVGEYTLVFRKQAVFNNVDQNYNVSYKKGAVVNSNVTMSTGVTGYAIVNSTTTTISEPLGDHNYEPDEDERTSAQNNITYSNSIYDVSASYIDVPYKNAGNEVQNSAASPVSAEITIVPVEKHYATLTIVQRDIMFYIGTYDGKNTVTQRFIIEQNEQVPVFPLLNDEFTTYYHTEDGDEYAATDPSSKQTHYVTWFDINQYGNSTKVDSNKTYAPRQVRTGDIVRTSITETIATHMENGVSKYGVYICSKPTGDIQAATYDDCSTTDSNDAQKILYADANKIVDNKYVFDTSVIGDYALIRNKAQTYVAVADNSILTINGAVYESRNYVTDDFNGTLVIYEDQTAPQIQVGNDRFVIEANADSVPSQGACVTNATDASKFATYSYECEVDGKLFDEVDKINNKNAILGNIIKYMTLNFSGYDDDTTNNRRNNLNLLPNNHAENRLPASLATLDKTWIYQPVNNIGIKYSDQGNTPTTLYNTYRHANTYAFDTDYIDTNDTNPNLRAISTIVSWFNINSYDYSFIRGEEEYASYISKRYTPRYYFYISSTNNAYELTSFDPTYVGDFTVSIYAIDDVGNQSSVDVTLSIVDTTKPTTGEMHVFNHDVECKNTDPNNAYCQTRTINSWFVKPGYVPIDAFIKYKKVGTDYIEDNTNGLYIKLNGDYVHLYDRTNQLDIYTSAGVKDILGGYVSVEKWKTQAVEVEHKYWSNNSTKYLVVVGGTDNSYIDLDEVDDRSQWDTYYAINDTSVTGWYKYERHAASGTPIVFKNGVTALYTRVLDTGRKFTLSEAADPYVYYNNIYLRYDNGGDLCDDLEDCEVVDANTTKEITQVSDAPVTKLSDTEYKVKLHSIIVTYDTETTTVSWTGGSTDDVIVDGNNHKFPFGIMSCIMNITDLKVNCETSYKALYNTAAGDKKQLTGYTYTITAERNIGDWDEVPDGTITVFNKDRRYIFIDTAAPTFDLAGEGHSIFEYDNDCAPHKVDGSTGACKNASYREYFLNADDTITGSTSSSIAATALTNANDNDKINKLSTSGFTNNMIIYFTGAELKKINNVTGFTQSGLLANDTLIMSGSASLDSSYSVSEDPTTHDKTINYTATTFNKHKLDLVVYLTATQGSNTKWYKYTAIYNGSYYYVYMQAYSEDPNTNPSAEYPIISSYSPNTNIATLIVEYDRDNNGATDNHMTTIEEVLEYIVSTASGGDDHYDYTFNINYVIRDAANNASAHVANVTVRGITYTRLQSTIFADVPAAAASLLSAGDEPNTYSLNVNQGASLATLLNGFGVSNFNNNGINNMDTVRQTLYYNGEVLFENLPYNSNVLSIIDSYGAPGTYTLKFTSTREVVSQGKTYMVEDDPLVLNFIIDPAEANVDAKADYTTMIVPIILMSIFTISLLGFGYVSVRKKEENN